MIKHYLLPALAAASLLSGPVFAQPAPATPPTPVQDATGPGPMARRLDELHHRLAITPAQEPQWNAVVAALRDNALSMRRNPAFQTMRGGNTVDTLHAMADLARSRADSLQRVIPSVEALYQTMSPEQRQVADRTIHDWMRRGPQRDG